MTMDDLTAIRPNAAFLSAIQARTNRSASDAGFHQNPRVDPMHSLTVTFVDGGMLPIPLPKWDAATALVGKVDKNGCVDLTEQDALLIVVARKTPQDSSPAGAFNRARADYPSLLWTARSSIYNGAGARGEAPPYWCMVLTRNANGQVDFDQGCGVDSLELAVDGLVRVRPKAPCGLEGPPHPQCPDCKRAMVAGYIPGPRHGYGLGDNTMWREIGKQRGSGSPELYDLPVRSFRCPSCGLLRNYAFTHEDWHIWSKAETEREDAGRQ